MNSLQAEIDKAQALSYRQSVVFRLHRWIRIIFFVEVFVSALGFFFFPFSETNIVKSFDPYDKGDHYQHLATKGGRSFMLNNDRLRNMHLAPGDTIYLEKNLFYKTEAIFVPAANDSFFPASKMT